MKAKRITMDQLGEMINKGFKEAKTDLKNVEERLGNRIDGLEVRVGNLEFKVGNLESKVDAGFKALGSRIDYIALNYVRREEA